MSENKSILSDAQYSELSEVSLELERIEELADGVARTLTRAFRSATIEGKSLKSLLSDIGRSFADIALKAALKPVGNLVSGLVQGLFSATNPTTPNILPFAKGGVVSSPTYFSMGNGNIGLAGEAGPESIMPLARGPDGKLGVTSLGQKPININFNVTASDARSFSGAEAEISAMLLRAVKRGTRSS
ncbi:MAG: phage tail tape measure protein [Devosiaceae bacterium]|nr:phage tail tape measure protein [Devosiaceae bacterium]